MRFLAILILATVSMHTGQAANTRINSLTFSKDNRLLAVTDESGTVIIWQLPELVPLVKLTGLKEVQGVGFYKLLTPPQFSDDGEWFVFGGKGTLVVEIRTGKMFHLPCKYGRISKDQLAVVGSLETEKEVSLVRYQLSSFESAQTLLSFRQEFDKKYTRYYYFYELQPNRFLYHYENMNNYFIHTAGKPKYDHKIATPDPPDNRLLIYGDGTKAYKGVDDALLDFGPKPAIIHGEMWLQKDREFSPDYGIHHDTVLLYDHTRVEFFKPDLTPSPLKKILFPSPKKNIANARNIILSPTLTWMALASVPDWTVYVYDIKTNDLKKVIENPMETARAYARMGRSDSSIAILKRALKSSEKPNLNFIKEDSTLQSLKTHPGWNEIIQGNWYTDYERLVFDAEAQVQQGKLVEGEKTYSSAIALNSKADAAYGGRAGTLVLQKKNAEAEADCSSCLQINPNNLNCLMLRAELLQKSGNHTKAVSDLRRVVEIEPAQYESCFTIATLSASSNPTLSLEYLEKYFSYGGRNHEAYALKGKILLARGEKEHARTAYREALEINEKAEYFEQVVKLYLESGSKTYAANYLEKWKRAKGRNAGAQYESQVREKTAEVIPTGPACSACRGSGFAPTEISCRPCRGQGKITCRRCLGRRYEYNVRGQSFYCGSCHGEGYSFCYSCNGAGKQKSQDLCKTCNGKGYTP